jgi:hypothetical protein
MKRLKSSTTTRLGLRSQMSERSNRPERSFRTVIKMAFDELLPHLSTERGAVEPFGAAASRTV